MVKYKINLNNKLTLLYDKCYNHDKDGCFDVENINVKKVKMNDVKISLGKQ